MYQYLIFPHFKRQLKPLCKKYRRLKDDLIRTLENFKKSQSQSLGKGLYKIRMKSQNIPRGKNKSFRLVILIIEVQKYIAPIAIYHKSDKQDISTKELNKHLATILFEMTSFGTY